MNHSSGAHLAGLCPRRLPAAVAARRNPRRRMGRALIFGVCGLALAGCVSETTTVSISPPEGASAERALEEFVITVATADFIGENCQAYGLRKSYRDSDQLIDRYLRGMLSQGYSLQEMERAIDRLDRDAVANKGIARLAARGVDDIESICGFGRREVAQGTAIGRLLRT